MFGAALRLGLTSFGGPTAHIGYFREAYVDRRRWLDGDDFADLVALVQFLPGPASSQLGVAIGMLRAGPLGGLAAWLGFTLPSAAALIAFAHGVGGADVASDGWVHGLELAAVAVVALAVWQMARGLATGIIRGAVAVGAAAVVLAWGGAPVQVLVIAAGGLVGWRLLDTGAGTATRPPLDFGVPRRVAVAAVCLAVALLGALPLARHATDSHAVALSSELYQSGALVFGGGHVVLPLLHERTVTPGWVSEPDFVAGYGAAQAVPGPLFTFAGYLGAVEGPEPSGVAGGSLAIVAIFLPGLLLVVGAAPFWTLLRTRPVTAAVLAGVNAAVVGLLFAALCRPLVSTAVTDAAVVGVALAALGLLAVARLPPWAVVAACAG
ncbi:MAG: chromate transporter, partial [Gaiellaceae bacterium]|nr:chromate transporter [Gaiellaceae bacterium]